MSVKIGSMKVKVDKEECISCNLCDAISDGAISVENGTDGKAEPRADINLKDQVVKDNVEMAANSCPTVAIIIDKSDE